MPADWQSQAIAFWPLPAALVLGYLVRIVLRAFAARVRKRHASRGYAAIVEAVALPASVAIGLLFLALAVSATPLPERWAAGSRHALNIGGILALTWIGVRMVAAIEGLILRRHPIDVEDNLAARRVQTQARVLGRVAQGAVALVGASIVLMTFPAVRQIGTTLLASAGVIGLVAGIAAKPVLGNLIAGMQIALTQPMRLDDVVVVDGTWGRVEEISSTYVVVRSWDERRLVVPLQWFIENPFENWTRSSSQLLGTGLLWLDYRTPMDAVRDELRRICESDPRWDGRRCVVQVTEAGHAAIEVRLLVSARNAGDLFDLRCAVRERMIDFLVAHHPQALPRMRANFEDGGDDRPVTTRVRATRRTDADVAAATSSPGPEDGGRRDPRNEDGPQADRRRRGVTDVG